MLKLSLFKSFQQSFRNSQVAENAKLMEAEKAKFSQMLL